MRKTDSFPPLRYSLQWHLKITKKLRSQLFSWKDHLKINWRNFWSPPIFLSWNLNGQFPGKTEYLHNFPSLRSPHASRNFWMTPISIVWNCNFSSSFILLSLKRNSSNKLWALRVKSTRYSGVFKYHTINYFFEEKYYYGRNQIIDKLHCKMLILNIIPSYFDSNKFSSFFGYTFYSTKDQFKNSFE